MTGKGLRGFFASLTASWALVGLGASGCGKLADDVFCKSTDCEWSAQEWQRVAALGGLPEQAPTDTTNHLVGNAAAEKLGQKWFFDGRFAGNATVVDQLKRPVPYARAAKGQPANVSCASCHDLARGGIDDTSVPNYVSIGTGWFDVNAQPVLNAAFYDLSFWNGRTDSLWAQAIAATEGPVSMNSSRLHVAWVINDLYAADYDALAGAPLPMSGTSAAVQAIVDATGARAGQCTLVAGACPTDKGCVETADAAGGASACYPRFPLQGKPGSKAGCQPNDTTEPYGDAWDCMAKDDQDAVTRVFVVFGKALAAYEARLISRNSAFDTFVTEGAGSTAISSSAVRGARLFVGRAACSDCHNTPLLADNQFHDIGVPQVGAAVPTEAECPNGGVCDCVEVPASMASDGSAIPKKDAKNCLPWGFKDGVAKLKKNAFRRDSVFSDDMTDMSRQKYVDLTVDEVSKGKWRTPSLRDVALTAPYMHDGCFSTLEEVVDHYDRGGAAGAAVGAPAPQLRPLFLSATDKADLIEFLKTLSGELLASDLRTAPVLP